MKDTGEEITVSFEDLAEGKVTWTTEDGEGGFDFSDGDGVKITNTNAEGKEESFSVTPENGVVMSDGSGEVVRLGAGKHPSWIPVPRGVTVESLFTSTTDELASGSFHFQSDDSTDAMRAFYSDALESAGYTLETASTQTSDARTEHVMAKRDENEINVLVTERDGEVRVAVQYVGQER